MRRFPGVAFRGDDYRRRAWVLRTGFDVWEIVALLRDFESAEDLAREYELNPAHIRLALAYYRDFPEEIDVLIERGRRPEREVLERHPFIATFEQARGGGAG